MSELVCFSHGFVEDGRDDAAMRMPWRSDVALVEFEPRNKASLCFIEFEDQAHAFWIIWAAAEAMVTRNLDVLGVVSWVFGFRRHS